MARGRPSDLDGMARELAGIEDGEQFLAAADVAVEPRHLRYALMVREILELRSTAPSPITSASTFHPAAP